MTLVVSEISEAGILLVADSAVSYEKENGTIERVEYNARKVVYNPLLRIGVSCWGNAEVGDGRTSDEWIEEFLGGEE